jgi:hypothetical protein
MGAPQEVYCDPSIAADSGDGSSGLPHGDLQYCLDRQGTDYTRDTTNGDRINIKAGDTDEILAAVLDLTAYGTPTGPAPLIFRGYASTPGDGGIGGINCNSAAMLTETSVRGIHLIDLHVHNAVNVEMIRLDRYCLVANCDLETGGSGNCLNLGAYSIAFNNYMHDSSGRGFAPSSVAAVCLYNFFQNETRKFSQAIKMGSSGGIIAYNVMDLDSTSDGIEHGFGMAVIGNSIYMAGGTGVGINATGANNYTVAVVNNLVEINHASATGISDNSTNGVNLAVYGHNAVRAALGTAYSISGGITDDRGNNVTLTASPFVDAANSDFRINPKAGSGRIKAFGWPTVAALKGLSSTVHGIDIGAIQRREWPLQHPGMSGGFNG